MILDSRMPTAESAIVCLVDEADTYARIEWSRDAVGTINEDKRR